MIGASEANAPPQKEKEADKGEFISHEAMVSWVDALGTENEVAPPKPDISPARG